MKGQHQPSGGGMADSLDFLQMQQLQQQVLCLSCTTVWVLAFTVYCICVLCALCGVARNALVRVHESQQLQDTVRYCAVLMSVTDIPCLRGN
jgi:hypothetical protein